MNVVDLCCGDGWFTFPLSKIARRVIAIDIDRKLLDAAKLRFDERGGAPNVALIEADAYDLENCVREPIDHVFLANVFHGVPDQPRLTRAVRDVLKPGGVFAIVSWYARPPRRNNGARPTAGARNRATDDTEANHRGGRGERTDIPRADGRVALPLRSNL
jgi:ubiquinone/menaquinone biosynthesis C-methylase UbiE